MPDGITVALFDEPRPADRSTLFDRLNRNLVHFWPSHLIFSPMLTVVVTLLLLKLHHAQKFSDRIRTGCKKGQAVKKQTGCNCWRISCSKKPG